MRKQPGDPVQLGDTVGHPIESNERYARIVGIRKDRCKPMERFILRRFKEGDSWFPTGTYHTTWLIVPYREEDA